MRSIEVGLEVHRAIEAARTSFEQSEDEILRRLLGLMDDAAPASMSDAKGRKTEAAIPIGKRTTGQWSVIDGNTVYLARNLREAYITAVARLSARNDGLMTALAALGGKRRRMVADSPEALFPKSPHLAKPSKNNWHQLGEWYVDLNLSRDSVAKRIKQACALSGINYGHDFQVREGLQAL